MSLSPAPPAPTITHEGVVVCSVCASANLSAAAFCGSCGTRLLLFCWSCGTAAHAGQRYCLHCGCELVEERRVVTVLFADIVGFTTLSERLDPEDVRELSATVLGRLAEAITLYGGTIDKFMG